MKKSKLVLIIAALITLTVSCKKGEDGAPGKDGNANVLTVVFTNQTFNYSTTPALMDLGDADITQDVLDRGSVSVYARGTGITSEWIMLPSVSGELDVSYSVNHVKLSTTSGWAPIDVKVVVIPPY